MLRNKRQEEASSRPLVIRTINSAQEATKSIPEKFLIQIRAVRPALNLTSNFCLARGVSRRTQPMWEVVMSSNCRPWKTLKSSLRRASCSRSPKADQSWRRNKVSSRAQWRLRNSPLLILWPSQAMVSTFQSCLWREMPSTTSISSASSIKAQVGITWWGDPTLGI